MNSWRPFGPQLFLLEDANPDLTVGAIASRRFAPWVSPRSERMIIAHRFIGGIDRHNAIAVREADG